MHGSLTMNQPSISESRTPSVLAGGQQAPNRALKSAKRSPLKLQHSSQPHCLLTGPRLLADFNLYWNLMDKTTLKGTLPEPTSRTEVGEGDNLWGDRPIRSQSHGAEKEGEKQRLEAAQIKQTLSLLPNPGIPALNLVIIQLRKSHLSNEALRQADKTS